MGGRHPGRRQPLEQCITEEIERGAAKDGDRGRHLGVAAGMVQHEFVGDGGADDAKDDRDVQIGIAAARDAAGPDAFGGVNAVSGNRSGSITVLGDCASDTAWPGFAGPGTASGAEATMKPGLGSGLSQ